MEHSEFNNDKNKSKSTMNQAGLDPKTKGKNNRKIYLLQRVHYNGESHTHI